TAVRGRGRRRSTSRAVVRQEPARRTLARTALAARGSLADPGRGWGRVGDRRTALAREDGGVDPRSAKRTHGRPFRVARWVPQLRFERAPGGVRTDRVLAGRAELPPRPSGRRTAQLTCGAPVPAGAVLDARALHQRSGLRRRRGVLA